MDKEVVYVKSLGVYDIVASPGFSSARMMGEIDWVRMKREKEIKLRKDKIDKIKKNITSLHKLGEVHGVPIYCDIYHPDKKLSIKFSKDGTEIDYIISKYDDITLFENVWKSKLEYRKAKIKKIIDELNKK